MILHKYDDSKSIYNIESESLSIKNVIAGKNVDVSKFINLYDCILHTEVFVGPFVEIQGNVEIGSHTRISSHSFICSGVIIGQYCFIGHAVTFINDLFTSEYDANHPVQTVIGNNVKIGSNATILPVSIGDNATIGAGAVVTKNVPAGAIVKGNPGKISLKKEFKTWPGLDNIKNPLEKYSIEELKLLRKNINLEFLKRKGLYDG